MQMYLNKFVKSMQKTPRVQEKGPLVKCGITEFWMCFLAHE